MKTKIPNNKPAQPKPNLVPPRQYNVMSGKYEPPAGPVVRPGALDFKRVSSVGYPC